ncbi:MAG TPA: hypothetical protein PLT54_00015 [Rhodoferax sp.]|jgi:hypothetical protein|nr:hypothetical protein [Rhodoferax sp.]
MKRLFSFAIFSAMLLSFATANAGLFDVFKTKDPHYQADVAACWSRVSSTISQQNRKIDNFRIEHKGPNPKTGYRTVMFSHQQAIDTRGCIIDSAGTINYVMQ